MLIGMNSKTGHTCEDSDCSDEDFPPFVEAVRHPRKSVAGGQSAAEIRSPVVSREILESASDEGMARRLERSTPTSQILEQLGQWRIAHEIGRGGMGIVYEAVHVETQQHVALKFLPSTGGLDARRLERFRHEAEIIARLTHPNLVRLLSIENEGSHHFLVMQLVDGISLDRVVGSISTHNSSTAGTRVTHSAAPAEPANAERDHHNTWLNEKLFGPGQNRFRYVATLIQQAAQALSYAHAQRVIHRDIKPSNLLVDQNDVLLIADFGLAQIQGEQGLTATGDLLGTLRYMSPEQAMASRVPVDHRTDVYSLGATLYELLCGDAAFHADDRKELLRQVLFDEPIAMKKKDPAIPVPLQIIVEKAMRKDPRQRYSTAGEMADDLFRWLSDSPIRARPVRFWEPALRWCRKNRALAVSLATVFTLTLLLTVGRFIYLELHERHERTVNLLQRTESAEKESQAFARLRDVARYRQTGLAGLRDRMALLKVDVHSLSDAARTELRNEWLSCQARADWSFTQSIVCESAVAAVSPSGELLAELASSSGSQQIRIRSIGGKSPEITSDAAGFDIKAVWFSRVGKFLVATDLASNWQILRVTDGRRLFEVPQQALGCDVSDATDQIVFWHVTAAIMTASLTGEVSSPALQTLYLTTPASFVRFSPDGRRLAILDQTGSAKLTLMQTDGTVDRVLPAGQANTLAWSPDGRLIALPNQSSNIIVRDIQSLQVVSTIRNNDSVISGISWHPSGNFFVTTSWTGEILLRHVWTGRTLIRSNEVLDAISFSHDGRRVGWQVKSGLLRIAEWSPGEVVDLPWDSVNNTRLPAGICFHPEGRLAAIYSLEGCQLFDLRTASVLHRIPGERILSAEFSVMGDRLVILTQTSAVQWPVRSHGSTGLRGLVMGPPQIIPLPTLQSGIIARDALSAIVRAETAPDKLSVIQLADGKVLLETGESAPGFDVARTGPLAVRRGWREANAEVFDFQTAKKLAVLDVGIGSIPSASDDSRYFVSSTLNHLQFWNCDTWERSDVMQLDAPVVGACATFHPTLPMMVVRLMSSRLGLINPETRKVIARIDQLEDYWTTTSRFSPGGEYFVELSSDPSGARVWNIGRMRRALAEHGLNWRDTDSGESEDAASQLSADTIGLPLVVTLEGADSGLLARGDSLKVARDQLQVAPNDPRFQNMVAWRLLMASDEPRNDREALELARLSYVAFPDSAAIRNTVGLACYRNGLYDEAEQILLKNLRTSRQEDLTMDLIILSMIEWVNNDSAASDSYLTWAENNFAEHPPGEPAFLAEIDSLFAERAALIVRKK